MPAGWAWPHADRRLVDTHWAYDLGARELGLELAAAVGAVAVLSRYSRLLVDPNRPETSETLFRTHAEGLPIELNTTRLDGAERRRRIERLWQPYHAAVDRALGASRAQVLLSMHTFTPIYEGARRAVEIGVLFDREEALAVALAEGLGGRGHRVALNEPYSGRDGLIYAPETHAQAHGRRALELEVRQDLAVDPAFRRELVALLAPLIVSVSR
jgi:predicted N-formylglutamate amidohydrolase